MGGMEPELESGVQRGLQGSVRDQGVEADSKMQTEVQ